MNPSIQDTLKEAHEQWLEHPVTQQLIVLLEKREAKYIADIQASVLIETLPDYQQKLRANISSVQTILKIATNTETFVELSTQQPNQKDK